MLKQNIISGFMEQWTKKAGDFIGNKPKIEQLTDNAKVKLDAASLIELKDQLVLLVSYIKDITAGRYTDHSKKNLTMAVAGLVYLVSPVDIIPDNIPLLGRLDDATVLKFVLKQLSGELEQYSKWKQMLSLNE